MRYVHGLNKSILLVFVCLTMGCQQNLKSSDGALGALDPGSHSDADVCRFFEFSSKWAKEAEIRGLDCSKQISEEALGVANKKGAIEPQETAKPDTGSADLPPLSADQLARKEQELLQRAKLQAEKVAQETEQRIIEAMYAGASDSDLCLILERQYSGVCGEAAIYQRDLRNLKCRSSGSISTLSTSEDRVPPNVVIESIRFSDPRTVNIIVRASDLSGIGEITLNGRPPESIDETLFGWTAFVPREGLEVKINAADAYGLTSSVVERVERKIEVNVEPTLTPVNPNIGPKLKPSKNRVALVIGIEKYANAPDAKYASRDANYFADFAEVKLGIPSANILLLRDDEANEREILLGLKSWLPQMIVPDETELFVFYAGHGMPTADGTTAYLVPHDAEVRLLADTAISRSRFFDEIIASKPKSATFFFDNCYAGTTRSQDLLLAARPLSIKVKEDELPSNFIVFAAGESDQTAGVIESVRHGRFSYFLFKGLEGEADIDADDKISTEELHQFIILSVGRFSAGAQTPTMLGDSSRWVLR